MNNIKLIIEYDGTDYCGWQKQPNAMSIQETIAAAIFKLTGENVELNGSGRTDAGVHAKGQVANFLTNSNIPPDKFADAINSLLPKDIVIKHSCLVDNEFHSRFNAKGKRYSYTIHNDKYPIAIGRKYAYHVRYCDKLDIKKMEMAAVFFIGTYDFSAFMSTGSSITDTVRTIHSINISVQDKIIKINYTGNGFLYNMVRILTGTLLFCGISRIDPQSIPDIIKSKDRKLAGITAPANGLCLEEVFY